MNNLVTRFFACLGVALLIGGLFYVLNLRIPLYAYTAVPGFHYTEPNKADCLSLSPQCGYCPVGDTFKGYRLINKMCYSYSESKSLMMATVTGSVAGVVTFTALSLSGNRRKSNRKGVGN